MADYVIAPPPVAFVPVAGGGRFPVRRIFCVGRNYAEHAREMGSDPDREPPFFFAKPADALLTGGADMPYPPASNSLHHEMELVVALGMTRRDLQNAAKKEGKPWDMGKGFDHSAPIGDLIPAARWPDPTHGLIELKVNGAVRQTSDLSKLIWSVAETISFLSGLVRLAPGDLIFTGTPEGVAAVQRGDLLEGMVAGVGTVRTRIV
jgi:fumarylpyruvate hydrolase